MIISQANCDEQNSFASHYFPKDGDTSVLLPVRLSFVYFMPSDTIDTTLAT